jgi:YD repeat-containing protein
MTTYTYDPLIGMTSRNDANGFVTFYHYDSFGRLILVRDQDKKILKSFCYSYSGQPGNCSVYGNQSAPRTIRKNNCTGCQMGSNVTYTVPADTYFAYSQDDANALAAADLDANAQSYANANGTCSASVMTTLVSSNLITNKSFSVVFHNNCTGSNYNYTLNQNTSNVSLSPQLPSGNYNVTFTPVGGGTTSYGFWVNGFYQYSTTGNLLGVDVLTSGNTVRVYP